jgi:hypothetical protein
MFKLENLKERRELVTYRHRGEDNIKMNVGEIGCEVVSTGCSWIYFRMKQNNNSVPYNRYLYEQRMRAIDRM